MAAEQVPEQAMGMAKVAAPERAPPRYPQADSSLGPWQAEVPKSCPRAVSFSCSSGGEFQRGKEERRA